MAPDSELCCDLRTCPNPRDRRYHWRFLGIFASPQDAIDAYEATLHDEIAGDIHAAGHHLQSVDMDSQHLATHADFAKDGEKTGANLRIESMKKATNKARKPSKAKAPKGMRQVNPILDMLKNMDEDLVAMLRQTVQKETGFGSEMFGPEDPVDLFAEYLESCALTNADEDEKSELLTDLVVELSDLKVASNGGDREAREKIQAIYDLLDNAIEGHSLDPIDMMMTGKIFTDAGWAVPDSLRQAMAEALQAAPPDTQGVAGNDIVSSLLELADQAGQNPFDVYEYMNSLLASFPPEASVMLLFELVAGKKAVIDQAVAGFVLHPDAVLAQSVAEALAASATQTPVESSLIERLVRMRPWLPQTRQAHLDATIRAMRLNALHRSKRSCQRSSSVMSRSAMARAREVSSSPKGSALTTSLQAS